MIELNEPLLTASKDIHIRLWAAATVINLPEDAKGTTTIESKTNFIGGAREGTTLIATATPVHRGRRTQVWQTRLETEDGKLVAVVTQTQMVLV